MQTIKRVNNPALWRVLNEEKINNDTIYTVEIGSITNYFQEGTMVERMSRIVFEKIMTNKYDVEIFPYEDSPIRVYDEDGDERDLIISNGKDNIINFSKKYPYNEESYISIDMEFKNNSNKNIEEIMDYSFENNKYNFDIISAILQVKTIINDINGKEKNLKITIHDKKSNRSAKYKSSKLSSYTAICEDKFNISVIGGKLSININDNFINIRDVKDLINGELQMLQGLNIIEEHYRSSEKKLVKTKESK